MKKEDHDNDTKYFECMAKLILKDLIPDKTENLINSESPDLQDNENNFGIEVVRALNKKDKKIESLQSGKYINEKAQRKKEKLIKEKLKKQKYDTDANVLELDYSNIIFGKPNSFSLIFQSFKDKIEKLQTYDKFDTNALFIFSSIYKREIDGNKILDEFKNLQSDFEYKFDYIYICTLSKFYVFNMKDFKYEIIEVDEQQKTYYSNKAKEELYVLNNK